MARGEKSGNPGVKRHRASRIAERMMEDGATRAEANRIATAAMDREYAADGARRTSGDADEHDSRTGRRKTNLSTKKGIAVSGASKPSAAKKTSRTKASSAKRPRGAGAARKAPMAGGASTAKKSSGVTRTARRTQGAG